MCRNQFVLYENESSGIILPQVMVAGTLTRRAVEATWLTASNPKVIKHVGVCLLLLYIIGKPRGI